MLKIELKIVQSYNFSTSIKDYIPSTFWDLSIKSWIRRSPVFLTSHPEGKVKDKFSFTCHKITSHTLFVKHWCLDRSTKFKCLWNIMPLVATKRFVLKSWRQKHHERPINIWKINLLKCFNYWGKIMHHNDIYGTK